MVFVLVGVLVGDGSGARGGDAPSSAPSGEGCADDAESMSRSWRELPPSSTSSPHPRQAWSAASFGRRVRGLAPAKST